MQLLTKISVAATVLAVAVGVATAFWYLPGASANLSPEQVDRLRMQALAGQTQGLPDLRKAARRGNLAAQRAVAEVLLRQPETAAEGVQFAEMAAAQGDVQTHFMLGQAYFSGNASGRRLPDMARARHWLELAAERKHAQAMYLLGLMHKSGYTGQVDLHQAVQWFARAVQLRNADAMFMLGNAYQAGEGVAADQAQALRLYKAAAELEHPLAVQTLALAYRDGGLGLKPDKREADLMMMEVAHILSHPGGH